ncbi:MAG: OsmC family protein [Candidatus Cloacimonas sp.]|jgi:putative redox protein|nr:OsmC family protein [Candidatus Cloacimonas sp.]
MPTTVKTKWVGGMLFDAEMDGHHVLMDTNVQQGGKNAGPRPKPLLLTALAGCSGMDVVSILAKMKLPEYSFDIDIDAESTTEHPITYHAITIKYMFKGENLPQDKIVKAVTLSTEKYCGVNAMLKKAANIVVKIYINDYEVS